ncbi:hypothetical protein D5086_018554 [Populus alba]|uniref:Uncharacterized protein n=1 Tax=Populus alba TaxID=43335 RepID=A0ACC4BRJ5_POPAL
MCISFSKRAIHIDIVAFSSVDNDYAFVLKNIWVLGVSLYLCYLAYIFHQDVMEEFTRLVVVLNISTCIRNHLQSQITTGMATLYTDGENSSAKYKKNFNNQKDKDRG